MKPISEKEIAEVQKQCLLYENKIGTIQNLCLLIEDLLKFIPHQSVECRKKTDKRIKQKLILKQTDSIFSLRDVYGFRIYVKKQKQGYVVADELKKHFTCVNWKDYFTNPKPIPSTKDVHRTLQATFLLNSVKFELQITTPEFHAINEKWHSLYVAHKYNGGL